jgi:hypothetical protein
MADAPRRFPPPRNTSLSRAGTAVFAIYLVVIICLGAAQVVKVMGFVLWPVFVGVWAIAIATFSAAYIVKWMRKP